MAGVEHHHVGFGRVVRLRVAVMRKGLGHALAVVDVHLTAVSLDEDLPGLCHARTSQLLFGGSLLRRVNDDCPAPAQVPETHCRKRQPVCCIATIFLSGCPDSWLLACQAPKYEGT